MLLLPQMGVFQAHRWDGLHVTDVRVTKWVQRQRIVGAARSSFCIYGFKRPPWVAKASIPQFRVPDFLPFSFILCRGKFWKNLPKMLIPPFLLWLSYEVSCVRMKLNWIIPFSVALVFFVAGFLVLYDQYLRIGVFFEFSQILHHETLALIFFALAIGILLGLILKKIIHQ